MASRRVLLPMLVAAFALLGPGQALAAPQFIPSESMQPTGGAPDVTTDTNGGSAAAWNSGGHIYVAERPRGGPWGTPEDRAPAADATSDPRIAVLPDGELVVAWQVGNDVLAATKARGGGWSASQTLGTDCCTVLEDVVAGADGSALVFWNSSLSDGTAQTALKPPGAKFAAAEPLNLALRPTKVAVAPDGSAIATAPADCGSVAVVPCIRAQILSPGGGRWSTPETVSNTAGPATGIGVASRSGAASFTVAWGESSGAVHSTDRSAGGTWSAPLTVPGTPATAPAGCPSTTFGCVDLASRDDGLAVIWQAGSAIAGSVRSGGGAWTARESVGSADSGDATPEVAVAADGTPLTAWRAGSGSVGAVVRGAHRVGSGTWQQQDLGATSVNEASLGIGDVAADGQGDGLAGFLDAGGSRVAGFDGSGPRFSAFSLPSGGSLIFSAAADDNWSNPVSISWLFGDGTGANGATVSHAYGVAGTFVATGRATDAAGNATEQSGPVTVSGPPGCGTTDTDHDGINDGCDANNGAKKPIPFKTVNATVVSGEVLIKLPAGSASAAAVKAPKGFAPLEGAETIPVGATLDTAHGRVKVRSAADTRRKKLQTGEFFRGRFVVRQVRIKRRSKKLVTDMRLTGSSFSKACKAKASIAAKRKKRSKKRVRRLFGSAKGSFRTTGRNAAATVRGTRWSVQDRCDGTLVTVQRGRVEVRDKVKRKTIIVRTGHTYLARLR